MLVVAHIFLNSSRLLIRVCNSGLPMENWSIVPTHRLYWIVSKVVAAPSKQANGLVCRSQNFWERVDMSEADSPTVFDALMFFFGSGASNLALLAAKAIALALSYESHALFLGRKDSLLTSQIGFFRDRRRPLGII